MSILPTIRYGSSVPPLARICSTNRINSGNEFEVQISRFIGFFLNIHQCEKLLKILLRRAFYFNLLMFLIKNAKDVIGQLSDSATKFIS